MRGLFAHIRKFHYEGLLKNTTRRFIEEADTGKALRVYWTKTNDFDEEEETQIFVCLSTNKTFATFEKATLHFNKDKAALKDHNKQLKQLKKDYNDYKKKQTKSKTNQNPTKARWDAAMASNAPQLAMALWRGMQRHKQAVEYGFLKLQEDKDFLKQQDVVWPMKGHIRAFERISYNEAIQRIQEYLNLYETYKTQRLMDVKTLYKLYSELWFLWSRVYEENLFGYSETFKMFRDDFNNTDTEKYYNLASDEMPSFDF